MLKIRLSRVGRKHEPVYRLVLTDSRNSAKSGRFQEILGTYDSRNAEKAEFNAEKIQHWISKGAQPSDTAYNLMLKKGIIKGERRNVLPKSVIAKARAPKEAPKVESPAAETPTETPEAQPASVEPELRNDIIEQVPSEAEVEKDASEIKLTE